MHKDYALDTATELTFWPILKILQVTMMSSRMAGQTFAHSLAAARPLQCNYGFKKVTRSIVKDSIKNVLQTEKLKINVVIIIIGKYGPI